MIYSLIVRVPLICHPIVGLWARGGSTHHQDEIHIHTYMRFFFQVNLFLNLHGWEKGWLIWLVWGKKIRVCRQWEFSDFTEWNRFRYEVFVEGGDIFLTLGALRFPLGHFNFLPSKGKCGSNSFKSIMGCWNNNKNHFLWLGRRCD